MTNGKVITFINMKGGVGKTTLCREIGYTLNKYFKKSILFIDIDPQANLTQSLFEKYNLLPQSLYDELEERDKEDISVCNLSIERLFNESKILPEIEDVTTVLDDSPKLSLIPGDLETIFLDRSSKGPAAENSLDKFIYTRDIKDKFDYILIDCPPTYSFYTTTAFNASDYYIVPVGIDPYSVLGIDLLEQVVERIKGIDFRRYKDKTLLNMGIIFNPITYTSIETNKNQFERQQNNLKNSSKLKKYHFFYFKEFFDYSSSYKEKLDYFSLDIGHTKNKKNIISISKEFIDRVNYLIEQENEKEKKNGKK